MANADPAYDYAGPASALECIWLEDFLALAKAGSFSRAAQARGVTQPAFSRRIKALEDWVGAALFERGAQPVVLTPAGRRFEPAAGDMLRRMAQARHEARLAAGHDAPTLRFAATHVLSFTFFPRWFHALPLGGGTPTVHLMSDSMMACEHALLRGEAQFLLCHRHPAAPARLEELGFMSRRVGDDCLCAVASPKLLGDDANATDPRDVPVLGYSRDSGLGRIVEAALPGGGDAPVFVSHLAAVLHSMARDGRGLAWLPLSLVKDDLRSGTLRQVGGGASGIPTQIVLFRPICKQPEAAERLWQALGDS
jgi:LysR family transcriptional regulator, hypochlorite-specific transcription factor HypT